jgi:hypothetical protein
MNLSAFRKVLVSAKLHSQMLSSTIVDKDGNVRRINDFAPVSIVQSNCFALKRNGQDSYVELGKASDWEFKDSKAIKNFADGKMILEFKDPSFFGF